MEELRNQFNETVNLGVIDGTAVVYLEMVQSRRSLRMQAKLGSRAPIYSPALGKAMLASRPPSQWPTPPPARIDRGIRFRPTCTSASASAAWIRGAP